MVFVDIELSKDDLSKIAKQVFYMGKANPNNLFEKNKGNIKLAETFPLYRVNINSIKGGKIISIKDAERIGYHHQVLFNKEALAFAISHLSKDNRYEVGYFSESRLAKELDSVISLIESKESKFPNSEVRLLKIPDLHLFAFWFLEDAKTQVQSNKFLFIKYGLYHRELPCGDILDEKQFISELTKLPRIVGVRLPKDEE